MILKFLGYLSEDDIVQVLINGTFTKQQVDKIVLGYVNDIALSKCVDKVKYKSHEVDEAGNIHITIFVKPVPVVVPMITVNLLI
jgi:hypothetical protein